MTRVELEKLNKKVKDYEKECSMVEKFKEERTLYNGQRNPYWRHLENRNEILETLLRQLGYTSILLRPHKEDVTYEHTVLMETLKEMAIL